MSTWGLRSTRTFPVIRLELDLGALEQWPTAKLGPAFVDGLVAALPGLAEHGCSYREPGGFIRRMREGEGTWLGHVLEHVAIELQNVAGEDVTFGKTRSMSDDRPGVYSVVYEYAQKEEGIAAGELALKLLDSLLPAEGAAAAPPTTAGTGPEERDGFIRYAQRRALGPSTMSLVRAAEERGIPWLRLNEQSLVQLGHGKYQQRIQATVTGRTRTSRWNWPATRKRPTRSWARSACRCRARCWCTSQTDAMQGRAQARRPGGDQAVQRQPRPRHHHQRLTSDDDIREGFEAAREHSRSVIVETYLAGDDHRLLVVNGELVAATRRTPGHVVGDACTTMAQLVEIVNQDPRRGVGHEKVLTKLKLDRRPR
jgi:cyanophycin synthetase